MTSFRRFLGKSLVKVGGIDSAIGFLDRDPSFKEPTMLIISLLRDRDCNILEDCDCDILID